MAVRRRRRRSGAWEFHERLIPTSPVKPIRIWMEVGDRDLFNPNVMRDNMHDWVVANENMAKALAAKGYHYQFVVRAKCGTLRSRGEAADVAGSARVAVEGISLREFPQSLTSMNTRRKFLITAPMGAIAAAVACRGGQESS